MQSPFRPLAPGEPIGVVALSGPVDEERLDAGLEVLRSWGHPVVTAPNLNSRTGYLAGGDGERIGGLNHVLRRGARVLVAARGGYGVTRLVPRLDLQGLAATGVMVVGFSDVTALMNGLVGAGGGPQIHGPMVAVGLHRRANESRLRSVLLGELQGKELFSFRGDQVVRAGRAIGRAMGGNLAMIQASSGTNCEAPLEGAMLFLEEVGEAPYRLDRMLTHLRSSGRFHGVKALICGSLRHCGPASKRDLRWRELVFEAVGDEVPVVVGLPFGHGARNLAFPIGVELELDTDRGTIRWSA